MKKNTILLFSMSMFTLACGMPSKSDLTYGEQSSQSLDPETKVTYEMIKSEILSPKCISCHSEVSTEKGLSGWVTPGNPEASDFFTQTENGSMPKNGSPLSTRDLEMIRMYITQLGSSTPAPTKPTTPTTPTTPAPDPSANPGISYAEVKSKILDPYRCTSCHSVGTEAKLAKWLNKTSPTSSRLYTTTKNGSMPQGGSDVTAEDQAFILQYVKDYAARN